MATYHTIAHFENQDETKVIYKGTSKKKAMEAAKAHTGRAHVGQFVKYNHPLMVVGWNDAFKMYVEGRGRECVEGMLYY